MSNKPCPESILAWRLAALSSIRSFGIPEATAVAIPPISSIYKWIHEKSIFKTISPGANVVRRHSIYSLVVRVVFASAIQKVERH